MSEGPTWVAALLAGVALGGFFFGVLQWSVRRAMLSEQPAKWFVGSMVLRTSVVLLGFYAVGHGHWERFVLCLLGFALAKLWIVSRSALGPPAEVHDAP